MSRNELENKTVKELHSICTEKGLRHYEGKVAFTKAKLVETILEAESNQDPESTNAKVEEKVETNAAATVKEKEVAGIDPAVKQIYIDTATAGQLVAFREESGKLNTAAIVGRKAKSKLLRLITQYNKEFIIPYDSVVWVRVPGKRWPRFVYDELKGVANGEINKQA